MPGPHRPAPAADFRAPHPSAHTPDVPGPILPPGRDAKPSSQRLIARKDAGLFWVASKKASPRRTAGNSHAPARIVPTFTPDLGSSHNASVSPPAANAPASSREIESAGSRRPAAHPRLSKGSSHRRGSRRPRERPTSAPRSRTRRRDRARRAYRAAHNKGIPKAWKPSPAACGDRMPSASSRTRATAPARPGPETASRARRHPEVVETLVPDLFTRQDEFDQSVLRIGVSPKNFLDRLVEYPQSRTCPTARSTGGSCSAAHPPRRAESHVSKNTAGSHPGLSVRWWIERGAAPGPPNPG